jgi:hypothetical protein
MKRTTVSERAQAWFVDYSAARRQAIRWLGTRYLLARPINVKPVHANPNTQISEYSDVYPVVPGHPLERALCQ